MLQLVCRDELVQLRRKHRLLDALAIGEDHTKAISRVGPTGVLPNASDIEHLENGLRIVAAPRRSLNQHHLDRIGGQLEVHGRRSEHPRGARDGLVVAVQSRGKTESKFGFSCP